MSHSKIISAIDIGSSKVTTLIGQYFTQEEKFNVIAASSIPAQGFRKGQIINIEQATQTLVQSIESAERMAGMSIHEAYVSLAAAHIQSLNSHGVVAINNPGNDITQTDVDRVIESTKAIALPPGKEIIHVLPRKYTVDGQEGVIDPTGMSGLRLEAETHLILASTPALKNLHKCLDEAGITPQALVYSGLAASYSTLTDTEKELGVALIDIGGSITSLTIFNEGSPCYSFVLPVGANNVTNDMAIGLRYSLEDAEKIKLRLAKISENKKYENEVDLSLFGIDNPSHNKISLQTAINGIIKPRLEEIFSLLENEIESSGFSASIPSGIVLTGGGALTVNAKEVASQIIPLPLRVATPPKIGGLVDDILNPAYASAIGLLFFGLKDNTHKPSTINNKKSKINVSSLFGKIKNLIEPLLP